MAKKRHSRVPLHERAAESGELAALIVGRREQLGLRQEELSDLAGCSPRFVHAVENGKETVQLDKVLSVLNVLGLHLLVADGPGDAVASAPALRAEFGLVRQERP